MCRRGEQITERHRWQEGHQGRPRCREELLPTTPGLHAHGRQDGHALSAESTQPTAHKPYQVRPSPPYDRAAAH